MVVVTVRVMCVLNLSWASFIVSIIVSLCHSLCHRALESVTASSSMFGAHCVSSRHGFDDVMNDVAP